MADSYPLVSGQRSTSKSVPSNDVIAQDGKSQCIVDAIVSGLSPFFESISKHPGDDFAVGCRDDNYNISWSGPMGPLSMETEPRVEMSHYATILHFRKSTEKHSGNYTCSTRNDSKVVSVVIKLPLDFMDTPPLQTAIEFQKVFVIKCEVKGGIKPMVSWYTSKGNVTKPKFSVLGDGLAINHVTMKDAGIYICKATELHTGTLKERNITLKVEHKPYPKDGTVWAKQESAWGFVGSVVNLSCEAIAEPVPRFEWNPQIKNHGKIFNDTNYVSVMQVNITSEKVFGNYTCKVVNKHGSLIKVITLEAAEQPQPPDSVLQDAENSDLMDIKIVPPSTSAGLMAPTGFIVQYRRVDLMKPHGNTWKERYFNISSENSYTLRNLQSNTKYDIRVATKNVAGLSEFTNVTRMFTLASGSSNSTSANAHFFQYVFLMFVIPLLLHW